MADLDVLGHLRAVRAVPVLRSPTAAEAVEVGMGLAEGGLTVLELTFSTPGVTEAIEELSAHHTIVVGAGTVMNEKQARAAVKAGARFLVSPVSAPWLVKMASDLGVVAIPGAATPTEVWQAHLSG